MKIWTFIPHIIVLTHVWNGTIEIFWYVTNARSICGKNQQINHKLILLRVLKYCANLLYFFSTNVIKYKANEWH